MLKNYTKPWYTTGTTVRGISSDLYSPLTPEVIGNRWWRILHYISTRCDNPRLRDLFKKLMYDIMPVIYPCAICRVHLKQNLAKVPNISNYMNDTDSVVLWLFNLHNEVNKMLNKPQFILTQQKLIQLSSVPDNDDWWFVIHSATIAVNSASTAQMYHYFVYGIVMSFMNSPLYDYTRYGMTHLSYDKVVPHKTRIGMSLRQAVLDWSVMLHRYVSISYYHIPVDSERLKQTFGHDCEKCKIED